MLAAVRAVPLLALLTLFACERSGGSAVRAPPDAGTSGAVREAAASSREAASREPPASGDSRPTSPAQARTLAGGGTKPPLHGCALRGELDLGPGERVLVAASGDEARVVSVSESGRELALYALRGEGLAPLDRASLPERVQRATLSCGRTCELAWIDEKANLRALTLDGSRLRERGPIATRVDRRFAPALAQAGERVLYAYTSSVDEAMHTFLIVRSGDALSAPRDLTPPGHGAAAPVFILGSEAIALVVIDARAGVSPLLEIPFDDRAEPKPAIVRTPVSQPYAPPFLSAVRWGDGRVEVFYTVVGKLAMTAVGRVTLRTPSEPTALLPSRGYGELAFATALARDYALFALEVPLRGDAGVGRALDLKLADGTSTFDALSLDAGAERPSLAALRDGTFVLGYRRAGRAHIARLACAR